MDFLKAYQPDIVALQETKVEDPDFPQQCFQAVGYHCIFTGQKSYNGVALLSRKPLQRVRMCLPAQQDSQCRLLSASTDDAIKIINLYAPNGASVDSEKYHYKLQWFSALKDYLQATLKKYPQLIVLGDFNIAPENKDVHDPDAWAGKILVSELERTAFQSLLGLGLHDSFRLNNTMEGQYTWWDYRQGGFRRNHGLRIDHILCSTPLLTQCTRCEVDATWRKALRPSDHAPVIAWFK